MVCLAASALAQVRPTPDATLVAGAERPVTGLATDQWMLPYAVAVKPDGTLCIGDRNHVWLVGPAGDIRGLPGPWEDDKIPSLFLAVNHVGDLYVASYDTPVWKVTTTGQVATVAAIGKTALPGASPT